MEENVSYIPIEGQPDQCVVIVGIGTNGVAFLRGPDSNGNIHLHLASLAEFEAQHFILHTPPAQVACEMLQAARAKLLVEPVVSALEKVIDMNTKGKTAEAIHAEVVRLAGELPAQHALKVDWKKFPNRASAIAAFTAVRAAHFEVHSPKEKSMSKKVKAGSTDTKPAKAGKGAVAAATPPAGTAAAPPAATPETATAPAAAGKDEGKGAKPTTKASKGATALAGAAKAKSKRASNGAVNLAGPFKLGPKAEKVKTPAELRMHEGSARYALMDYVLSSKKKSFTVDELKAVKGVGDQVKQALSGCVRYEFLAAQ